MGKRPKKTTTMSCIALIGAQVDQAEKIVAMEDEKVSSKYGNASGWTLTKI